METKPRTQALRLGELFATMAGCVWWSVAPSASAQESEAPTLFASLSVATMQPEVILSSIREPINRPTLSPAERTGWPVTSGRRQSADTRAWERFEAEFEPQPDNPSNVKRQIEAVKYDLDTTVFALDRFIKSIRDHADFEFNRGNFRRTRADSHGGFLDNPRVKLDLDMARSKPYLGVRVVIPFGN